MLRAFSVYGYWESPTRLIPTVIKAVLNKQELALTAPGYRRDFIFVEDVIEACLLTLKAKKSAGEVINVGSGQQWSNEEVVEMAQTLCGRRIKVRVGTYPARPSDKAHWLADITKFLITPGLLERNQLKMSSPFSSAHMQGSSTWWQG